MKGVVVHLSDESNTLVLANILLKGERDNARRSGSLANNQLAVLTGDNGILRDRIQKLVNDRAAHLDRINELTIRLDATGEHLRTALKTATTTASECQLAKKQAADLLGFQKAWAHEKASLEAGLRIHKAEVMRLNTIVTKYSEAQKAMDAFIARTKTF